MAVQHNVPDARMTVRAIEQTYVRYRAELRTFFSHQARHLQAVDDLVQEVYERMLRYPPPAALHNVQSYLFQVAWNVLNETNRRAQRDQLTLSCDIETLDRLAAEQLGSLWVEDSEADLGTQEEFERALGALPRVCRVALLLQRRDGLSYKQIAERMDISVHTVKKYIGKALAHFRDHLRDTRFANADSIR